MTTATPASSAPVDLKALKAKQQVTWASGDFAVIGTTLQIVGELLCEAADVGGGERVLDVAAGNGNATLAAARRFAHVTSTDYVPALLEGGRRRAEAEGLAVTFEEADAEALPYPAASFDVILSTFGVMFAPDHAKSSSELLRVCRLGGRIGLASWTPEGFIGQMFRVVAKHVPPPAGVQSPLLWGTRDHLQTLFARCRVDQRTPFVISLPVRVGRTLRRDLPDVLRPGAQGVRGTRRQTDRRRSRPICSRCWSAARDRRPPDSSCPASIWKRSSRGDYIHSG